MIAAGASPLLDHAWGISLGADRVWAQIAGIAPRTKPWERLFVVLQADIDESYTERGTFVMGGYIATAETWARFSEKWEPLLPMTLRNKLTGRHRFKMKEMARLMGRVPAFYRVIEEFALFAVHCKINLIDLSNAKNSIWAAPALDIDWGYLDNPYRAAFRYLMDMFHTMRFSHPERDALGKVLPLDQKIDFYFDDHTAKGPILAEWDDYIARRPEGIKDLYGATPRFESDEDFYPLQAADFWAWWARRAYERDFVESLKEADFGYWKGEKPIPGMAISFTEDEMAKGLVDLVRPYLEPGRLIYRVRFYLNGQRL